VSNSKNAWAITLFAVGCVLMVGGLYLALIFAFGIAGELVRSFVTTDYAPSAFAAEFDFTAPLPARTLTATWSSRPPGPRIRRGSRNS
jgi:hypothetical protein